MSKKYDKNLNEIKDNVPIKTFSITSGGINIKNLGQPVNIDTYEEENKQLKQQLADTEAQNKRVLEKLELLVKDNQDLQQQLAEKDKAIENLRKEFSLRLRLIRHPICEEIRRFIRQPENSIFYDVSLYVETAGLEKLLDNLEKGE